MLFTQQGIPVPSFNACGTKLFQSASETLYTADTSMFKVWFATIGEKGGK